MILKTMHLIHQTLNKLITKASITGQHFLSENLLNSYFTVYYLITQTPYIYIGPQQLPVTEQTFTTKPITIKLTTPTLHIGIKMVNEIVFNLTINPKDPSLLIANNNEFRYTQAKIYGDVLRYYKAGIAIKHVEFNDVELSLSVKLGSKGDLIKRDRSRYCVVFNSKLNSILFNGETYKEFPNKIEFELLSISACEINNKTGEVLLTGTMDPKLDMQTFIIGYPLGQTELVKG